MRPVSRTLVGLSGLTVGMFVFAWSLVPLYDLFCEITGLNGKVTEASLANEERLVDSERSLQVRFVTTNGDGIEWDFEAVQPLMIVHPGVEHTAQFRVRNRTDKRLVARAIPSVVPGLAVQWLRKIECFCFQEQGLDAGAEAILSMRFYFEAEMPAKHREVVIAYTLYQLPDAEA